ncbi:MAG: hypothetical protein JWM99_2398 [Verrucomicrobiales bacterium]|nr:hypothetical protein [Verrucomicrobiales bacterium]
MHSKDFRLTACVIVLIVTTAVQAQDKPAPSVAPNISAPSWRPAAADPGAINLWLRELAPALTEWDLGVQFRARVEHAESLDAPGAEGIDAKHGPVDFRKNGGDANNDRVLFRELFHVGYSPVSWATFYVEGRDSSSIGDDRKPSPDADEFDLHQGYIRLGDPKLFPITAKVGRQELIYGDERLIGASDWTNQKRTFDAAKLRYETDDLWVDAFVARPVITWEDHFNESNDYDWLSGIYASSTTLIPVQESQLYLLSRNSSAGSPQFYGPSPDPQGASARDIYTIGTRFKSLPGKLAGWDYTTEAAGQFGDFKETAKPAPASVAGKRLSQLAYAAAVSGGYTWTQQVYTPRVALEYVYSSGDSDPTDGTHGTFDNLFPTNHRQYGIMDLFSWQNVQNLHISTSVRPSKVFTVAADYRLYWLADRHDSFYNNKGARRGGLAATNGLGYGINPDNGSFLGSEIDLVATYTFHRYASVQGGIGHYFVGNYVSASLAEVGGATDGNFIYAQLTLGF